MIPTHDADIKFACLTNDGTHPLWNKNVEEYASQFGDAGKAWLSGVRCAPRFPQYGDMVCDKHGVATIIQKYEHIAPVHDGDGTLKTPLKLSPDGIKDYKKDVRDFPKVVDAYNVGNNAFAHFIILHLGSDVKKGLFANPLFVTALRSNVTDTFAMMTIISDQYSKGTGRTKVKQLQHFLGVKQGDLSHEAYVEKINEGELATRANYESVANPGFIAISDLAATLYLGGLDPLFFKYKLELVYASNPTGHFPDVASLMADFAVYAREHRDDSLSPLQYSSALVANSLPVLAAVALTLPGSPKCIACSAPITTVDARTQLPHKHCGPCFRDFMSKRKSVNRYDKPGPIVKKPTSAQLLAARAMVASFDALPPTLTPASPGLQQPAVLSRVPTDVIADDFDF